MAICNNASKTFAHCAISSSQCIDEWDWKTVSVIDLLIARETVKFLSSSALKLWSKKKTRNEFRQVDDWLMKIVFIPFRLHSRKQFIHETLIDKSNSFKCWHSQISENADIYAVHALKMHSAKDLPAYFLALERQNLHNMIDKVYQTVSTTEVMRYSWNFLLSRLGTRARFPWITCSLWVSLKFLFKFKPFTVAWKCTVYDNSSKCWLCWCFLSSVLPFNRDQSELGSNVSHLTAIGSNFHFYCRWRTTQLSEKNSVLLNMIHGAGFDRHRICCFL